MGRTSARRPAAEGPLQRGPTGLEWFAAGPVYQDCEVDRKAERRGGDPRINFTPAGGAIPTKECYRAAVEFVVDTSGAPELGTVRLQGRNDRDLEEAVRMVIPSLHYRPAQREGMPVRQLVVYERKVGVMVRVTSSSGRPAAPVTPRPPRC